MPPLVSVVLPIHNAEKYLLEAVESILTQTFADFELILVDDGSTDHSPVILDTLKDPRIIRLRNEKNSGVVASLNLGISVASGRYIARMDADDVSLPERLEKQVKYLEAHPEIGVLGTGILTRVEVDPIQEGVAIFPSQDKCIRWMLCFRSAVAHVTAVYRRNLVVESGLYRHEFLFAEDYDLWVRLISKTQFSNLSEPLVLVRYYVGSSSQLHRDLQRKRGQEIQQRAMSFYLGDDYFSGLDLEKALTVPEHATILILTLYQRFTTYNTLTAEEKRFVRKDVAQRVFDLARASRKPEMWKWFFRSLLLDPHLLLRFWRSISRRAKIKIS